MRGYPPKEAVEDVFDERRDLRNRDHADGHRPRQLAHLVLVVPLGEREDLVGSGSIGDFGHG